jgi:hypothetical protein|tara:strand:+ start:89 stop:343 length:255 start_codon:yes stop_codon:yes gene_type:complete
MKLSSNPWDWEYYPIPMTYDVKNHVTTDKKDIVKTAYQVWDHTCCSYGDFNTYDLAKAHAEHLCINHQYESSVYKLYNKELYYK